jgi:TonB-linked SusC/RagA family outer membrane protein
MRKIVPLLTMLMLVCVLAFAQTRTVTGRVTDASGSPIPFATITEAGTNNATTADANGNYTINIRPNARLTISATGHQSQTVAPTGTSQNVSLAQGANNLQEVVVTAAGGIRVRQKEQGYTSTVIKSESLTQARPISVASGLAGKVAGLNISGVSSGVNPNYRVVLRGMRSLTGNNEALIVIDNVIVPNAVLSNLNPDDVADVTVLNGPNAAALYGSEASNGALLITTKKGTKGRTSIRISHTLNREEVAFYPKLQNRFGSGTDHYFPTYVTYENQQYGPAFDGTIRQIGLPAADGTIQEVPYSATDEKKKFWEKGLTNQTDIAFSTGGTRSTLYFSAQYAGVKGTTPGDEYNRASARINGTHNITNNLDLSFNAGYTQNRYDITTQTGSIYDYLLNIPAQIPVTRYKDWRNDPFANPNYYFNAFYNNPYFIADNYRQYNRNDYFVGSAELKFTPLRWLDLTYRAGITTRNQSNKNTTDIFNFNAYAKANNFGTAYKGTDIVGGVTDASSYTTRLNSDLLATFRKTVAEDFSFRLTTGFSVRQDESKSMSSSISGLVIPGLFNLNNSTNPATASEANFKARQFGVYGDLNIGYKNFLFLHATGRNDVFSILAEENRSFFYPSVDVSFVPTDAFEALKNINGLDNIKLRAGWSRVGNVNLGGNFGAYRLDPTFSQGSGFPYAGAGGFTVGNQLVAPELKPEFTTGIEAGFDVNLFKQRISASFTYFSSETDNQTVSTGISTTTGFSSYLTNTGVTSNKGIESSLTVVPLRTKDWTISVGGNYTYMDNIVESISADLPRLTLGAYGGAAGSYAVAGQPFPVLMGNAHKRDPEGRIIVDRLTGLPSATDTLVILGNAQNKHMLGVNTNISFRGFRLAALAEYRGGHYIYNAGGGTFDFSGAGINTVAFNRERFVIPNSSYLDPASGKYVANNNVTINEGGPDYWSLGGPRRNIHENYITSAAFWKLREVSLSYDLPTSVLSKVKFIKAATVTLQGRNLLILLPESNVYTDPEYSDGDGTSSGNAIGLTNLGQTPPSRYYGATLSVTF